MRPEDIPAELIDILDRRAGKVHSRSGSVVGALAEILTEHEKIWEKRKISMNVEVHIPDNGSAQARLVQEIRSKLYLNSMRGSFADALFDVQKRVTEGPISSDGTVLVILVPDGSLTDDARRATLSWSGAISSVAEEIYLGSRSISGSELP